MNISNWLSIVLETNRCCRTETKKERAKNKKKHSFEVNKLR